MIILHKISKIDTYFIFRCYMIIEWSVENFLSFSDEQKLSCEATTDSSLRDSNVFEIGDKRIVKSVAVFGDNGGGKSNLLNALGYLQGILSRGILFGGTEDYPSSEYHHLERISDNSAYLKIELVVLLNEVKYHYGVSITCHGTVKDEFLNVYLTARPQQWFHRYYDVQNGKYVYELCVKLKGDKNIWEKATDCNELFLSKASKLGSKQILPLHQYLSNQLVFLTGDYLIKTANKLRRSGEHKGVAELCEFFGIPCLDIERSFMSCSQNGRQVSLFYEFESDTTLDLLDFVFVLSDVLRHGKTLIADSFLDRLHPITVRKVLDLFHNPAINTRKSQLFFTSHMVSLLDQKLLRRDQIWFVEKNVELTPDTGMGASELHQLTAFSPRKTDNIERNYLAGEYRSIPKPGDISKVIACFSSENDCCSSL